jgi:hypothetical protein
MISQKASVVLAWSLFDSKIAPVLEAAHIALLPVIPNAPQDFNSPGVFSVQLGAAVVTATGLLAKLAGLSKVDLVQLDIPQTPEIVAWLKAALVSQGLSYGKTILVPKTAIDYASYVAQITAPGFYVDLPPQAMVPFIKAYQQAGLKATIIASPGEITPQVIQQTGGASSAFDGSLLWSTFPASSDPAWGALSQALKSVPTGSLATVSDQNTQATWVIMQILKNTFGSSGSDVSADAVLNDLSSASNLTTGGLTPPLDLAKPFQSPYSRVFNRSAYLLKVENGQFVSLDNNTPHDMSAVLLASAS